MVSVVVCGNMMIENPLKILYDGDLTNLWEGEDRRGGQGPRVTKASVGL